MNINEHEFYMKKAIEQAKIAYDNDEVPVGAVIVYNNKIIARSHNLCEKLIDFTAHAEMQVFTSASNYLQSKYLDKCSLYVTLEPCLMCAGASYWTRIGKIVFGANDPKKGFRNKSTNVLHPKTTIIGPIMEMECSSIIRSFFSYKR
tara:strand:- start:2537 stop:2977 length:441 start_codon:yes stop_codon:yes gene_type:complete